MKRIVVVGGGFAGLMTLKEMDFHYRHLGTLIVLGRNKLILLENSHGT